MVWTMPPPGKREIGAIIRVRWHGVLASHSFGRDHATGRDALLRLFKQKAVGLQQRRKFWMSRFDDEFIRNREMILTKLEYIHNNPLKAGLAVNQEDYKYSSARNYILRDHSILQVETDW